MESNRVDSRLVGAVTAYLEVAAAGKIKPTVFPVHDEAVIGRDLQGSLAADRYICIPEPTVSRRHARIRRRDEAYFVEDLHSFNGTFVAGERLSPGCWHPLCDGDEVAVSSVQMVFHSLVVPAHQSAPSVIAKTLDATRYTSLDSMPVISAGDLPATLRKLHAMAQVGMALGAVTDRATLVEKIMNFIFDLFPLAERAFIFLNENGEREPMPAAARRRDGSIDKPEQIRISRTIIDQVLQRKQSILSVDTLSDRHFGSQESIISQAIRSVMCVPLLLEGEILGLIQVDTSSDPHAFNEQDLEMLTGVCAEAAVALKNFLLYSDIERLLDGFVRASVQAIEERDPVTAGHSFRVAGYAENLAQAVDRADSSHLRHIEFSREQLREIRYAALLHDFGKVGVREHVLRKEKKLHHADMRLLEQRFHHARACLEREAYRRLSETHAREELSIAAFRHQLGLIEAQLGDEYARLDRFLAAIRRANEPAISDTEVPPELREVLHYTYRGSNGEAVPLIDNFEFSTLCVTKGCLTAEERRQIESHVADSYSFLILIPWTRDLSGVPAIAHGHHEKLDGSGYPMGLKGDQICVQTRILTICDIYDALTAADRPYKKALPRAAALDLMEAECRVGQLDPALFRVFVEAGVGGLHE
ncbi:GAF domain-containing protein [Dechloromonas sp. XY25]|uniref:GAF domain-containing protein n=1 Tax=Dechloromonas hankyongensis TaxID=2908002 RepID=A0ABS9K7L7_9RHOO|nr:HD domain-containing phosphohydrolase [Dechloromonas hankyongensis]MCG2579165.1 GAF domain-containing protein [Dechloromonas hankyongensis]